MTKSDFPHPLAQIAIEQSRVIRLDRARKRRELARDVARDVEAYLNDPIMEANQRESDYWQSVGGRTDGVTDKSGFAERYELMLRELP